MRFAVINDIQGNLAALQAVLDDIDTRHEDIDRIVSTGDIVGRGPSPNDVIDLLRARGIESVLGNYDDAVAFDRHSSGNDFADEAGERADYRAIRWTRSTLTPENYAYLTNLPREIRLHPQMRGITVERVREDERSREYRRGFLMRSLFGGLVRENRRPMNRVLSVMVVHGSPRALNEFLRQDTAQSLLLAMSKDATTDVLISGHSGESFQRELDGKTFIGAGSLSGVSHAAPVARYVVVNVSDAVETEFHEVRYDPGIHEQALAENGLPPAFTAPFTL